MKGNNATIGKRKLEKAIIEEECMNTRRGMKIQRESRMRKAIIIRIYSNYKVPIIKKNFYPSSHAGCSKWGPPDSVGAGVTQ